MNDEYQDILMHNLNYLRQKHGLSQRKMARILGVGTGTVRKIEQSIWPHGLSASAVFNAAVHFGVRTYILLSIRLNDESAPPA